MLDPPDQSVRLCLLRCLVEEAAVLAACGGSLVDLLPLSRNAFNGVSMIDASKQVARLQCLQYLIEEAARIADEGSLSDVAVQLWVAHDRVMHDLASSKASVMNSIRK